MPAFLSDSIVRGLSGDFQKTPLSQTSAVGATWSSGCICAKDRCACFADLPPINPAVLFDPHRHRREPCGRESRAPARANRLLSQTLSRAGATEAVPYANS